MIGGCQTLITSRRRPVGRFTLHDDAKRLRSTVALNNFKLVYDDKGKLTMRKHNGGNRVDFYMMDDRTGSYPPLGPRPTCDKNGMEHFIPSTEGSLWEEVFAKYN